MKYVIRFKKTGVICFTSHLDIMKVFKRSFKRAGIKLAFSQGFNPHPKMGFAQPLSLGYKGYDEYMEFETAAEDCDTNGEEMLESLRALMPEGLTLVSIHEAPELRKTLASMTVAAEYEIRIPLCLPLHEDAKELWKKYMGQETITALKKQKKKKDPVIVDIKPKIRKLSFNPRNDCLVIDAVLDAGSESNLSPELLIDTAIRTLGIECDRAEISVSRLKLQFRQPI
ncbi:MAG: TIGR03936 family radical SAM-associated protein [Bacillota bacterium]|nr:TIGR03936 family radical SAM-associated protein [Bacillota bacterium]